MFHQTSNSQPINWKKFSSCGKVWTQIYLFCHHHSKRGVAIFLKQRFTSVTFLFQETDEKNFEAVGQKLRTKNTKFIVIGSTGFPVETKKFFFKIRIHTDRLDKLFPGLCSHINISSLENNPQFTKRLVDQLRW